MSWGIILANTDYNAQELRHSEKCEKYLTAAEVSL